LISKNYLGAVDRKKGKFRSFLLTALKHFLANEWDKSRAAKRGGGRTIVSLDEPMYEGGPLPEPASDITPGKLYESRWAQTVFGQAEVRLHDEFRSTGKETLFNAVKPFLDESTGQGQYPAVAASLGMSQGAVRMTVHRARQRLGELIREEVARTLIDPTAAEIDEELRHLIETFSRRQGMGLG
jgi:RNA polymerase sigma-70 factor (ECF subfamily)